MSLYLPRASRSLLNTPVAMSDLQIADLQRATNGQGVARVRGLDQVPEVEAQAALARLRGMDQPDRRGRPYAISSTGIAHISVSGDLVRTCDVWDMIFGGVTSYEVIASQIMFANEDQDVRGIFIQFSSYGGFLDGMIECGDFIYQMSARFGGKPIYGYAADPACSAAYLLFAACDEGYCGETGVVGSIGCKVVYLDRSQMLADEGVVPTMFRSRPGKALADGLAPLPETEVDRLQKQVDYYGSVFEARVSTYQPRLSISAVAATNALDYIALDAKATGLVNDVMSMPEAWAKLERAVARN